MSLIERKTLQSAAAATGDGSILECAGFAVVGLQISGTFTATVGFEGTQDGTNWVSVQALNRGDGSVATSATAAGLWVIPCAGLSAIRAPVTWTSGTSVTVKAIGTSASAGVTLADIDIAGTETVTANQGAPGATAWPVRGVATQITVTPVLDTNAYADGDVLFNPIEIPNAVLANGRTAIIQDIMVYDLTDQGVAMDLLVLTDNTAIGTALNAAPDIADENAIKIIARFSGLEWYDMGAFRLGTLSNLAKIVKAAAGSTSLYLAGISRGAGTYAADGLKIMLSIMQD